MLTRRLVLSAPLILAACADDAPPRTLTPLRFDYLSPLQLNVAGIDYAPLPPPNPLDGQQPVPAAEALRQMAQDRLSAAGSSGQAKVTVQEGRIIRSGNTLDGTMALRVDVVAADGSTAGFAEARASRTQTGLGRDLRGTVYDFTKQLLESMNVELEFQLRRSLRDYLQTTTTAPAPAAVQQQDLAAPRPAP